MGRIAGSHTNAASSRLRSFLSVFLVRCVAATLAAAAPAHAAINANKSFTPDVVSVGQKSTITFYFLNANTASADSLAFTDVLPTGMVVAPAPNTSTTCGGAISANAGDTQVSFSGGSVPAATLSPATPGSCQIKVDVVASTADVYINTIAAGDVTSTQGGNSQAAEATLNVSALVPISGTKAFAPTTLHGGGDPSIATITLTNPNGVALTDVTFTDPLNAALRVAASPAATTTCGGTLTGAEGAATVSLAGGTIPANGSCIVTFPVRTADTTAPRNGNVNNVLVAGSITTFEGVTNPTITSNNLLVQSGIQVLKAFSPTSITSGGTSTMTITVRNFNATAASPLGFTDNFPTTMRVANPLAAGGTCVTDYGASFVSPAVDATSFTVTGGSLPGVASNAGNTFTLCTFTIDVTATNAATNPATRTNTIPANSVGGLTHAQVSAGLVVYSPSNVSGTKAFSTPNGAAVLTNWILATVSISNAAATTATNVALTDALTTMGGTAAIPQFAFAVPGGGVPAAASDCGGTFNTPVATPVPTSTVTFSGGTIAPNGTCTLTYPVLILPNATTGTRTNTIPAGNVSATIGAANVVNTIPLTAQISIGVALSVVKSFTPTTVVAGNKTRLQIQVNHVNGAVPFSGIAFTDTLPAGHLVASPANVTNSCGGTVVADPGTGIVQLSGGSLGTGATSCAVLVDIVTPAGSAGSATNTLAVGSVTTDQGVANRTASSATVNRLTGPLTLAKTFIPATVALNGTSTMQVRILNNAPGAAALSAVSLTDSLPAGMVVHSTPGGSWSGTECTGGGGITAPANGSTVAISGKSIAAGATCLIQVTVRATAAGNLINTLPANAVASTQGVSNLDPVAATLSSTGLANLGVTKTDGKTQVVAGTSTTYTITVTSASGSSMATVVGATFTDPEPAGATFTSWTCTPAPSPAGSSCTASGSGSISDTVNLPPGGSLVYTVNASISPSATGTIVNIAHIEPPASVIDTDTSNNTATDTDTVVQQVSLAVAKTDNSLTYTPGGTGTYVITVTNGGPSNGTGINVADTLPDAVVIAAPGVSCAATGTASCGSAGANTVGTQAVSYTGAAIAAGAGNSIQLTVPVAYPSTMTITPLVNTAVATHVASGASVNGSDSSVRSPAITLGVTKSDGSATYTPGATATYTIVVTNSGATLAGSVGIVDPLPTGVLLNGTITCTPSSGSTCGSVNTAPDQTAFSVSGATIAGGGGTLTYLVPVAFGVSMTDASITNTATATAADPQLPPPGTVSAQGSDTNTRLPVDLGIAKSHAGNFFQGQSGAQFSIVVTNNGLAPTFGAVGVADALPAGLTATAISGTGWTCTLSPLGCSRSDALLAAQSYPAITVVVDVATTATSPLVNQATVSGGGDPSDSTANDTVVVDAGRDLTIVKSHTGNFFQGQVGAQFTLSVQNVGGTASSGTVTVTDSIPSGLTATSITGGSGWSCTQPAGPCTNNDSLAAGASYPTLTLTVNVATTAPASLSNVAIVSGGGDINPANNTATDNVTVVAGPDPTIAKSHSGSFYQGQVGAQFSITVQNIGGSGTVGPISVVDTLPAGLTATGIAGSGWSCTLATLTCTRSDVLAAGTSYPGITLTVDVATNAPASLTNSAAVSGGGDVNLANNTANDPVTVVNGPDITIAKSHVGSFHRGQVGATFTITVSNVGGAASSGTVSMTDTLPAGLTATAIAGTGWSCTLATLICTRSDALAASASWPAITLTVDVATNAPASLTNSAVVSGGGDVNPANNTANDPVTVDNGTDLTIAKTHAGNFYQTQVGATFTITVSNAGGGPSSGTVTVADTLPAGLAATAMSGSGWTCTVGTLSCTRSDALAAAASYPAITLTVDVAADAGSPLVNTATVSGGGDLDPANNTANDTVAVDIRRIDIVATPVCISDTPYVNYTVTPVGFAPGTNPVTWQWFDSTNTVRQTDANLPLSGQLLWPGAVVVGGVAVGWPGWTQVDGQWVQVDDGLRPTMRLVATVNPTAEVVVSYPPPTALCNANPRIASIPAPRPVPALEGQGLALLAAMLAMAGLLASRRRLRR